MNALKAMGLLLLSVSTVSTCCPETLSANPKNKFQGPRSEEILRDPHFENGFAISPLWPAIVQNNGGFEKTNTDTIRFRKKESIPDWQMAQWASKYDLGGTLPEKGKHGTIIYRNEGKEIARSSNGTLLLDITTSTEYDRPRTSADAWPHLLIQQDFVNRPNIGLIERLDFSMELRIVHCENRMKKAEFDENLHTAQSPFYFFMRNENPESPDYQLALWVGVPSFDYRYPRLDSTERVQWDIGTATYIYSSPYYLGRHIFPRPSMAQNTDRLAAIDSSQPRSHAGKGSVHTHRSERLGPDGHEFRMGGTGDFRRRSRSTEYEHSNRKALRRLHASPPRI